MSKYVFLRVLDSAPEGREPTGLAAFRKYHSDKSLGIAHYREALHQDE